MSAILLFSCWCSRIRGVPHSASSSGFYVDAWLVRLASLWRFMRLRSSAFQASCVGPPIPHGKFVI